MKYIPKNEEPVAFSAWKTQEAERLEPFYSSNNAGAAWSHLPSKPPAFPEENIQYYSKEELTAVLLKEQGYLCCYCNRLIHPDAPKPGDIEFNDRRTTVEHLDAKEADARNNTLRYKNLVASCRGGEVLPKGTKPWISYCNLRRGNKSLLVNPTTEDCEQQVYFTEDGKIYGETQEVTGFLHDILGLNNFDKSRQAEIRSFLYENALEYDSWDGKEEERPELQLISVAEAQKLTTILSQKDNVTGQYKEFCRAIISVLKREILGEV